MSYQPDFDAARIRRTNVNWTVGQVGAIFGARRLGINPTLVGSAFEGGNIAHRVYQETGDKGLAGEVGATRAVFFAISVWLAVWSIVGSVVGTFLVIGGAMSPGRPEAWLALVGLLMLLAVIPMAVGATRITMENMRLKRTGMPRPRYLVHAGYVQVGDCWVRPAPGYTINDVLQAHGYSPAIDVREV